MSDDKQPGVNDPPDDDDQESPEVDVDTDTADASDDTADASDDTATAETVAAPHGTDDATADNTPPTDDQAPPTDDTVHTDDTPPTDDQAPPTDDEPPTDDQAPRTDDEAPPTDDTPLPDADDDPPLSDADDQAPPTDDQAPSTDHEAPPTDDTPLPDADDDPPLSDADDQAPPTDHEAPPTDDRPLSDADDQAPSTDDQAPPTDDPTPTDDRPPTDDQTPPTDDRPPTDDQAAPTDDRPPTDDQTPPTDDTPSTEALAAELALLRADYEALEQQLDAVATPAPERKRLHRPSRYWVSIACAVLGGLLLPLAVLVRWTSSTLLDTDAYVETVAPLAKDEDIQEALSFRVSVIILDAIEFIALAEGALPPRAGFLAAPIESGVRTIVEDVVEELLATEAFERLWEDVNRVGHENVVAILTGEGNDTLETANGKVVVHLGPITEEVLNRLDEILGTDLENAIPDERLDGDFVLVESEDLANLQDEISLFDRLSWLIPILTIALLAASVIISRPRRLAFTRLGVAIAVPMAISMLLYDWIRGRYVAALPDDIHNPDAAAAFFDITTRFVPRDMLVLLVLGTIILFLTWLFGPSGWAQRARAWWGTVVGTASDASEGRAAGPAPRWVADNERTLLVFAVVLGVVTLLVWTRPTGLVVLMIVVVVAVLMATTSLLAEIGRRAEAADEEGVEVGAADGESSDSGQLSETGSDAASATSAPS